MIKSIFLVLLLATSTAFADKSSVPKMATLSVQPNFDYGLTRQEFRVHYSGVADELASQQVEIKIYKQDVDSAVFSFSVPQNEKTGHKAYFFALEGAQPGQYSVDVCAGGSCSGKNPALTQMLTKESQAKLTCSRGSESDGKFVESESEKISLDIIPATELLDAEKAQALDSQLNAMAEKMGKTYQTEWTKNQITKNPSYKDGVFYTAFMYDVQYYWKLFDTAKLDASKQPKVHSKEFCERKYILASNVHLLDSATKEVKYRFKIALHPSAIVKTVFLKQGAQKIHIELVERNADIKPGTYKIWVALCATEKDVVESTVCSDPYVYADEFTVPAKDEQ